MTGLLDNMRLLESLGFISHSPLLPEAFCIMYLIVTLLENVTESNSLSYF